MKAIRQGLIGLEAFRSEPLSNKLVLQAILTLFCRSFWLIAPRTVSDILVTIILEMHTLLVFGFHIRDFTALMVADPEEIPS
jgi:hypothetical protein